MSQDHNHPAFKKLLIKLQEESWQLELIISGFSIFGLFSAYEPITLALQQAAYDDHIYKFVIMLVAKISCAILIFNLLLHVLLRGLWIGTLGLRYVSGDIDYDHLNYSPKFTKYLKKRVGSFDKYIASLENYCSVIFAVSFLLIFYVLAITVTIILIALIGNYVIGNDDLPEWISTGVGIFAVLFIVFGMLLTLFDFLTQGLLKKKQWVSRLYFPIYWVFSFVTLSFLYRPLVYNFLDHKFGKRLSFVLLPVYAIILLINSLEYRNSNYLIKDSSSNIQMHYRNYEDELKKENEFVRVAAIQSKIITEPYVKVFVAFSETIENRIYRRDSTLRPKEDERGLTTGLSLISSSGGNVRITRKDSDNLNKAYLDTFNEIYSIVIDTMDYDSKFLITTNNKGQLGFETYVGIKNLPDGPHELRIKRIKTEKGVEKLVTGINIPFWYYKD